MNGTTREKSLNRSQSLNKPKTLKKSATLINGKSGKLKKKSTLTANNSGARTNKLNTIDKVDRNAKSNKTFARSKSKDNIKISKKKEDSKSAKSFNTQTSEVKISKNVDTISRLINNSNDILSEQKSLLEKYQEITKKVTSSDFEIDRLFNKNENDEFSAFIEKYGSKLNSILQKLKTHTEEVEEIKYVREENKSLKYKLELMSIDQNDVGLEYEAKFNSLKMCLMNEMNSFNDFLGDLGMEYIFNKFNNMNFNEEGTAFYFQNLKKLIKQLKTRVNEVDSEINLLNFDKKNLQNDLKDLKLKFEDVKWSPKSRADDTYNKNLEEDLYYYKNLVRDYEKQIEEMRRMNSSFSQNQIQNQNQNNISVNRDREYFTKYNNQNLSQNYEDNFNHQNQMPNTTFESFRRNKDLRMSTNTQQNDENFKLENRYSDSYFYKNENQNPYIYSYDYTNTQNSNYK